MSNQLVEGTSGLFVDDYTRQQRKDISLYLEEFVSRMDLPDQTDEWGCVSASGSFIMSQLMEDPAPTPAELDKSMDREPNQPGNSSKLAEEFLKNGLSLESYNIYSPLTDPVDKLAHGKITFKKYFKLFEKEYGKQDPEQYSLFEDYYTKEYIPSYLAIEERFRDYKSTGQMRAIDNSIITQPLLGSLVNAGKYVYATKSNEGTGSVHAIAIFRPELSMPAIAFVPGMAENNPGLSSNIFPLTELRFKDITRSSIGAVALWHQ